VITHDFAKVPVQEIARGLPPKLAALTQNCKSELLEDAAEFSPG
jgi:hypothetical protein